MQYPHKSRPGSGIVLPILTVFLLALPVLIGCNGDCPDEPVKHTITIVSDGTNCKLVGEAGTDVSVNPGEWVVWKNQYGSDVELFFGHTNRLFGVTEAVVYNNSELQLMILEGADPESHSYDVPCAETQPGPKIVVNPPN